MADQKISQLTTIVTVDTASDLFPIVDTSAAETKKITPSALKTALALNNVDNTSDANKPISSATQTALDAKQATLVSGTNIKTVNNTSLLGSGNISISSAVAWGGVTGTLSNQTDLQTALDGKVDENTAITGATKTKITYDAKGLVTAGADATTADIADSTNRRYVTDAQLVVVGNTSGTNTGDNATNSQYSGLATSKQDTLVSGTNIKTINSTSILGSGDIAVQSTIIGGASTITTANLTASRAVISNASGKVSVSSVTDTELGYVGGVTSAIQTQIDGKQNTITGAASTIASVDLTASRALASNASGKVVVSAVTSTELGYLSGTTSALQTQIDSKQATITGAATTITSSDLTASRAVVSNASGKVAVSTVTSTELGFVSGVTSAIQTQIDSKTNKLITTNRQTASYTLVLSDADKLVEMNVATANNLTIPLNSSVAFSTGTQILLAQYGAGQTTIVATSGVTIRSNGGKLKLNAQYSGATLIKIASDEWYLFGDIA